MILLRQLYCFFKSNRCLALGAVQFGSGSAPPAPLLPSPWGDYHRHCRPALQKSLAEVWAGSVRSAPVDRCLFFSFPPFPFCVLRFFFLLPTRCLPSMLHFIPASFWVSTSRTGQHILHNQHPATRADYPFGFCLSSCSVCRPCCQARACCASVCWMPRLRKAESVFVEALKAAPGTEADVVSGSGPNLSFTSLLQACRLVLCAGCVCCLFGHQPLFPRRLC